MVAARPVRPPQRVSSGRLAYERPLLAVSYFIRAQASRLEQAVRCVFACLHVHVHVFGSAFAANKAVWHRLLGTLSVKYFRVLL